MNIGHQTIPFQTPDKPMHRWHCLLSSLIIHLSILDWIDIRHGCSGYVVMAQQVTMQPHWFEQLPPQALICRSCHYACIIHRAVLTFDEWPAGEFCPKNCELVPSQLVARPQGHKHEISFESCSLILILKFCIIGESPWRVMMISVSHDAVNWQHHVTQISSYECPCSLGMTLTPEINMEWKETVLSGTSLWSCLKNVWRLNTCLCVEVTNNVLSYQRLRCHGLIPVWMLTPTC